MMKRIVALTLLVLMLFTLVSCQEAGTPEGTVTEASKR